MKRAVHVTLLMIMFVSLQYCGEDQKETIPDPIIITAAIEQVSVYGGNDGSIDLTVSGGTPPYSFLWSDGRQIEDIDSLKAGTYIVTVTDKCSQTGKDTFIVTQPEPDALALTITGVDVSIFDGSDGAAYASVTGGVAPYQYNWSDGSCSKDITGLSAGVYYLMVTDSKGSSVHDSIVISQPGPEDIIIRVNVTPPTGTGLNDGAIDVTISGGYPPYAFSWSDGSNQEDLFNLVTGSYVLVVTDQQGHQAEITVDVTDLITDMDGNKYAYIKIGEQVWMKDNLRVTHDPDGEPVVSYAYNDDTNYVALYGRLYTWDVAMNHSTVEQAQGICPSGWHVPSDGDYKTLEMFLGMTQEEADMENIWRGDSVGTRLIVGGTSGYDAQLSGRRSSNGVYSLGGIFEYMWTSSEYYDCAWRRCLDINSHLCGRWNTFPKSYGFSVRCIKDK